ncbi:PAS domain S-box protein [Halomicroarcula sp. GCM10025817]|uniref:PAS domain S-box protein n=1 Tax=Haloarcula TaxID=2237 RepID=UPI0023E895AC|nr:PAS domain S-box protein [Halomicroarcula sp. SYNS111]
MSATGTDIDILFRRVQDIADIGVWEYDPQSESLSWSVGVHQIHNVDEGYEPTLEEAIDFYHPDDRDVIKDVVNRAVEQGEPYDRELRIVRPDGTVRDIRAQGEVNTDENGETTLVRGVLHDITERKQRERELRQFREAVEHAAHAIYITDTDGTIEYVNPAFEEITGYTAEEAEGETPAILSSGTYDESFYADLWETVLAGDDWEHEMIDERNDGQKVILDQTIAPIQTEDGDVEGFVAINRDITERKEQEEQLQIYEYACNSALSGIAIAGLDGELRSVNPAFCEMWGFADTENVCGRPVTEFWSEPEAAAEVVATIQETGSWEGELQAVRQDGTTFTAYCSASYVENDADEPIALMSSFVDITERKKQERKLRQANEELEMLNHVVRHDIRNDMAVILGWAELLEEHVDDAGSDHLEKILTSGEHIVELTEIARDYVETVTSEETVEIRPTPLRSVLDTELTLRQESYPDADINTVGLIPDVEVQANEMLSSVFRNLLNNAVQHNDKDRPVVEVMAEEDADNVEIRIRDNGPGVPESRQETIFGKGEQSLESSGTGIGLYLVQMIVEQYGGDVAVRNNDPEGAVFTLRLPKAN